MALAGNLGSFRQEPLPFSARTSPLSLQGGARSRGLGRGRSKAQHPKPQAHTIRKRDSRMRSATGGPGTVPHVGARPARDFAGRALRFQEARLFVGWVELAKPMRLR